VKEKTHSIDKITEEMPGSTHPTKSTLHRHHLYQDMQIIVISVAEEILQKSRGKG